MFLQRKFSVAYKRTFVHKRCTQLSFSHTSTSCCSIFICLVTFSCQRMNFPIRLLRRDMINLASLRPHPHWKQHATQQNGARSQSCASHVAVCTVIYVATTRTFASRVASRTVDEALETSNSPKVTFVDSLLTRLVAMVTAVSLWCLQGQQEVQLLVLLVLRTRIM